MKLVHAAHLIVALGLVALSASWAFADQNPTALEDRLQALEASQAEILRELRALAKEISELRSSAQPPQTRVPQTPALPEKPLSLLDLAMKGNSAAPVVILEFSDFQCPFCGDFVRRTLPAIEREYLATNQVKLAFSHLPLTEIHPQAANAAESAECARRQGKFWEMHDALFSDQKTLDQVNLVSRARKLDLDIPVFASCVQGDGSIKVRSESALARSLGISVTPTFLIGRQQADGSLVVEHAVTGAKDFSSFKVILDSMLTQSNRR